MKRYLPYVALLVAALYFAFLCWTDIQAQSRIRQPSEYKITHQDGSVSSFELPPVLGDPDSICWMTYATILAEKGEWRLQSSPIGNTPEGRPMLWSHLYLWWILGVGKVAAFFLNVSWVQGIYASIFLANPLALVLFSFAWFWLVKRVWGIWPASVGIFLLYSFPSITTDFAWWHPDHHGFHFLAIGGGLTCAMAGAACVLRDERKRGLLLFRLSGVAGGIALWLGATQQITWIALLGGVAFLSACRLPSQDLDAWGRGWKEWAVFGAITSLLAFLIENFPHFSSLHLEVNQPAYTAAFGGAGAFVFGACMLRLKRRQGWIWLAVGGVLIATLPVAIFLARGSGYSLSDPMLLRCHEFIEEFIPAVSFYNWQTGLREFVIVPLLLAAGGLVALSSRDDRSIFFPCVMLLGMCAAYGALLVWQVRWVSFFEASLPILGILTAYRAAGAMGLQRKVLLGLLGSALGMAAIGMVFDTFTGVSEMKDNTIRRTLGRTLGIRDLAIGLRLAHGGEELRIIGDNSWAPGLYAYGRVESVGGLYWENLQGIKDSALCLASGDDNESEKIVRQRGITHIVVESSPDAALYSTWITHGKNAQSVMPQSLAWRLATPKPELPKWLELEREIQMLGLPHPVRIYRVLPAAIDT